MRSDNIERFKSKKFLIKFFGAYLLGILIAHTLIIIFRQEGFTITKLLSNIVPSIFGGLIGMLILYLLMNDKRFM